MAKSRLHELSDQGVSVWIDSLSREMLETGELARLIKEDAVVGVTSNPTIFQKALSSGDWYDERLAEVMKTEDDPTEIFLAAREAGRPGRVRSAAPGLGRAATAWTAGSRWRSTRRSHTTARRPSSRRSASTPKSTGRTCSSRSRRRCRGSPRSRTASRRASRSTSR